MQAYFGLLGRPTKALTTILPRSFSSISRSYAANPNVPPPPAKDLSFEKWRTFEGAFANTYDDIMDRNILSSHVQPKRDSRLELDVEQIWRSKSENARSLGRPAETYDGRSVPVRNGKIIPAYAALSKILSSNNVWHELRRAARHENKGEKRRRLESERWRKRFQREVREKVKLVRRMRRQDSNS